MRRRRRVLSKTSVRARRLVRRVKGAAVSELFSGAFWILSRLSVQRALRLAEVVGDLCYRTLRRPRARALQHLKLVFAGQLKAGAREHLARASFVNLVRCFSEVAKLDDIRLRRRDLFEVEGGEHVDRVLAAGRGCIALTGHVGNWELLAAYLA